MSNIVNWLLQPDLKPLLEHGQLVFLLAIGAVVFAESGLLIGFFLPGDSLLFSAGPVAALAGNPSPFALAGVVFVAAVVGDQTGYITGKRLGPTLFSREQSRFFKPEHMARSQEFFEHHGAKAVVLARFVPVVRTFTPVVAGGSQMQYRTFAIYNIVGAVGWAILISMLGYQLGRRYPGLEHWLTPVILIIVSLSLLPAAVHLVRVKARRQGLRSVQ